jgi:peptidoglycan/LPS O-acetylase OafA/YrhL
MDRKNFPALTGIRFIAASLVYLFHYAQQLFSEGHTSFFYFFLRQLNIGVTLFFVLSGFLITYRYYEFNFNGRELRYYFLKRIARIFPLYYAILAIQLLLLYLHGKASPDALTVFLNITLLKGLSDTYFFSVLTQSWSLTVEEMFYLYAPFCFYLIKAKKFFFLQVVILLGIGFLLSYIFSPPFFGGSSFMLSGTFFGRCIEFFTGIFLGLVLKKRQVVGCTIYYTLGGSILFTGLLILLGYYAYTKNIEVINDYFFGIVLFNFLIPVSIGVIYYGLLVERTWLKKLLSTRMLVLLGKSSYAFYLLHIGMIAEIIFFHVTSNLIVLYLLLQLLSVATYKLFEKPVYFFILRKFAIQKK